MKQKLKQYYALLATKSFVLAKLISAILLLGMILFALGALLLNNAAWLNLDKVKLDSKYIQAWYPNQYLGILAAEQDEHWYYQYDDLLFRDELPWQQCSGHFVGVFQQSDYLIVACTKELLLFDKFLRLLDRLDSSYGLPENIDSLGYINDQVFIRHKTQVYNIDLDSLELFLTIGVGNVRWVTKRLLIDKYRLPLQEEQRVSLVTVLDKFYAGFVKGPVAKQWINIGLFAVIWLLFYPLWVLFFYKDKQEIIDYQEMVSGEYEFIDEP